MSTSGFGHRGPENGKCYEGFNPSAKAAARPIRYSGQPEARPQASLPDRPTATQAEQRGQARPRRKPYRPEHNSHDPASAGRDPNDRRYGLALREASSGHAGPRPSGPAPAPAQATWRSSEDQKPALPWRETSRRPDPRKPRLRDTGPQPPRAFPARQDRAGGGRRRRS